MTHNYAEIYADRSREDLVAPVADDLGLSRDTQAVAPLLTDGTFEIEFRRNPDAGNIPGYMGFQTIIEVATMDGQDNPAIVRLTSSVVKGLRDRGVSAEPVARFESELEL